MVPNPRNPIVPAEPLYTAGGIACPQMGLVHQHASVRSNYCRLDVATIVPVLLGWRIRTGDTEGPAVCTTRVSRLAAGNGGNSVSCSRVDTYLRPGYLSLCTGFISVHFHMCAPSHYSCDDFLFLFLVFVVVVFVLLLFFVLLLVFRVFLRLQHPFFFLRRMLNNSQESLCFRSISGSI